MKNGMSILLQLLQLIGLLRVEINGLYQWVQAVVNSYFSVVNSP